MLRLGAVLVAAVLLTAQTPVQAAPSQQVPPVKGQAVSPNKSHEDAATPQRGTPQAPLVVEAHVSGKLQAASDNASQSAKGENSSWLDPIAIFTFLLVVVGAVQAGAIWYTAVVTNKAAVAARDGVELARKEFLAANPPHLVVRNVNCRGANPGENISINFEVINTGKANAHIVASAFRTDFVHESETFHDLTLVAVGNPAANELGDVVLIPGAVLRQTWDTAFKWQPKHFHDHEIATAGFFSGEKFCIGTPMETSVGWAFCAACRCQADASAPLAIPSSSMTTKAAQ